MKTWIPWEEIEAEWMKEPGFAEGLEQAQREFDAEIEKYGTIANPKPTTTQTQTPRLVFARNKPNKARGIAKLKQTRVPA